MLITTNDLASFVPILRAPTQKTVLHVGCGTAPRSRLPECYKGSDWREVRVDIDPHVKPDVVASLTNLRDIPDSSVESIWTSHSLEHLNDYETPQAVAEFRRVLRPGGFVLATLPDLATIAQLIVDGKSDEVLYKSPAGPITPIDMLFGHQSSQAAGNLYMAHRTGFTKRRLAKLFLKGGFSDVRVKSQSYDLWALAVKPQQDEHQA